MNAQTKHTPSPWAVRVMGAQVVAIDAPNGDQTIGHSQWKELATAYGCDDAMEDGEAVALANARLIAAAPELLEALRELLDSHDDVNTCDADSQFRADTRHEAAIRNASAAIAKATGEQP